VRQFAVRYAQEQGHLVVFDPERDSDDVVIEPFVAKANRDAMKLGQLSHRR